MIDNSSKKLRYGISIAVASVVFLILLKQLSISEEKIVKVNIATKRGHVTNLAIPVSLIPRQHNVIEGAVDGVYLHLTPNTQSDREPALLFYLSANDAENTLMNISLPNRIQKMTEVSSDFDGYRKYVRPQETGTTSFMLVGALEKSHPIYIECHHKQQIEQNNQEINKCVYFGRYDERLSYKLWFPDEVIMKLNDLVSVAENTISNLIMRD